MALTARYVPGVEGPAAAGPGRRRSVSAVVGLGGITYGLIAASAYGWAVGVGAAPPGRGRWRPLGLFILAEATEPQPMLPLGLFRSRQFSAANAVYVRGLRRARRALFLVCPSAAGGPRLLARSSRASALLPVTVIMLRLSVPVRDARRRIGPRLQMSVGPLVIAGRLLLFTRLGGSGDYVTSCCPRSVVSRLRGGDHGGAADRDRPGRRRLEHAGVASAVNNDVARVGRADRGRGAARPGRHHRV